MAHDRCKRNPSQAAVPSRQICEKLIRESGQKRDGMRLSYSFPLPAEIRRPFENIIAEYNTFASKDPSFSERKDVVERIKLVKQQLAEGQRLTIDARPFARRKENRVHTFRKVHASADHPV